MNYRWIALFALLISCASTHSSSVKRKYTHRRDLAAAEKYEQDKVEPQRLSSDPEASKQRELAVRREKMSCQELCTDYQLSCEELAIQDYESGVSDAKNAFYGWGVRGAINKLQVGGPEHAHAKLKIDEEMCTKQNDICKRRCQVAAK